MKLTWAIARLVLMYGLLLALGTVFALSAQTDRGSERTIDIVVAVIAFLPFVLLPAGLLVGALRRR